VTTASILSACRRIPSIVSGERAMSRISTRLLPESRDGTVAAGEVTETYPSRNRRGAEASASA